MCAVERRVGGERAGWRGDRGGEKWVGWACVAIGVVGTASACLLGGVDSWVVDCEPSTALLAEFSLVDMMVSLFAKGVTLTNRSRPQF